MLRWKLAPMKGSILFNVSRLFGFSSKSNENILLAKGVIDYIDKLDNSTTDNFFVLKELQQKLQPLQEEYVELKSIDPEDELAKLAEEECVALNLQTRDLLKEASKFLHSSRKFDSQDAFLEVVSGAGGMEAAVFAGEILQLYLGYIATLGFHCEIVESENLPLTQDLKNKSIALPTLRTKCLFLDKTTCSVHSSSSAVFIEFKDILIQEQRAINFRQVLVPWQYTLSPKMMKSS